MNCAVVVAQHGVYCARVVPHIRCLFSRSPVVASAHLVHETVCARLETWHVPRLKKMSCVHLIPHGCGARVCLSLSMEALMIALEERLRQTKGVLVAERLARQTAVAAQQTVGPQRAGAGGGGGERSPGLPSLVDTKAIGKPPMFSGDVDVNGQPEGMPWSQSSFVFRSYFGAFDPTATR